MSYASVITMGSVSSSGEGIVLAEFSVDNSGPIGRYGSDKAVQSKACCVIITLPLSVGWVYTCRNRAIDGMRSFVQNISVKRHRHVFGRV